MRLRYVVVDAGIEATHPVDPLAAARAPPQRSLDDRRNVEDQCAAIAEQRCPCDAWDSGEELAERLDDDLLLPEEAIASERVEIRPLRRENEVEWLVRIALVGVELEGVYVANLA